MNTMIDRYLLRQNHVIAAELQNRGTLPNYRRYLGLSSRKIHVVELQGAEACTIPTLSVLRIISAHIVVDIGFALIYSGKGMKREYIKNDR